MYTLGLTAEGNLFMWTTPYDELKPGFDKTKRVCRTPMTKRFGCTHPVEPLVGRGLEPNVTQLERIPGNGDHRVVSITQGENVIIALTADGELWTLMQGSFGRVIGEWEHVGRPAPSSTRSFVEYSKRLTFSCLTFPTRPTPRWSRHAMSTPARSTGSP